MRYRPSPPQSSLSFFPPFWCACLASHQQIIYLMSRRRRQNRFTDWRSCLFYLLDHFTTFRMINANAVSMTIKNWFAHVFFSCCCWSLHSNQLFVAVDPRWQRVKDLVGCSSKFEQHATNKTVMFINERRIKCHLVSTESTKEEKSQHQQKNSRLLWSSSLSD